MNIDLTLFSDAMAIIVLYYFVLYLIGSVGVKVPHMDIENRPLVVLVIPARNEALVIAQTLKHALTAEYATEIRILLVNDASSDQTGPLAETIAASDRRLRVLHRSNAEGGRGKSEVLNHAYSLLSGWQAERDPWMAGRIPSRIVLCILDADGRLSPTALNDATAFFASRRVGAVQVGVQIRNARDNVLARMQDIEFVGFSFMVQTARDRLGSVGLGGNGQFTRLSALETLGDAPWSPGALTEDLDLGLRLQMAGWRLRFCSTAWVDQQGLSHMRPLMRQRTRWAQGHYQCWRHIPAIFRMRRVRLVSRIDTLAYLVLICMVMIVTAVLAVRMLALLGIVRATNTFLPWLGEGTGFRAITLVLSWLPLWLTFITYQRYAVSRLRWWECPAFCLVYAAYVYLWALASVRAWMRLATRRGNWVKTPRIEQADVGTLTSQDVAVRTNTPRYL